MATDMFGGSVVKFVLVGQDCFAAVTARGELWTWVDGDGSRLGLGDKGLLRLLAVRERVD